MAKPHGLVSPTLTALHLAEFALPQRPLQHPLMDFERDEGRALACCATAESDLVIEAEIDEEPDAQNIPIRDFAGRVARIEDLTPTIKGVWIELDGACPEARAPLTSMIGSPPAIRSSSPASMAVSSCVSTRTCR